MESSTDDTSRRGMAAGPFSLSAAQRGTWFVEQVVGSAPIAVDRYIEIVGDLNLDVPAEVGLRADREFGTGYLRLIEIAPQCPTQIATAISAYRLAGERPYSRFRADPNSYTEAELSRFGPIFGRQVDSPELSADAAVVPGSVVGAMAVDGGHLEGPTGSDIAATPIFGRQVDSPDLSTEAAAVVVRGSVVGAIAVDGVQTAHCDVSTRMVTGYRPTGCDGDLMFSTAARRRDGSAGRDPGGTARAWGPHVSGGIYTRALGTTRDGSTAPGALPEISAVPPRHGKVDRQRLGATC
ncbi:hypothetical protein ACQP1G_11700 [Nocardia sp. CA-107356]|uniref:hypothetical protein n=1 Tax=Nocardia sp. CA-107356 TaxID=3239972 RepID=UPI003D8C69AE